MVAALAARDTAAWNSPQFDDLMRSWSFNHCAKELAMLLVTTLIAMFLTQPLHGAVTDDSPQADLTEAQQLQATEALAQLQERMEKAWQEYLQPLRDAKTAEEREKVELDPAASPSVSFLPEMLEFTSKYPRTDACLEAYKELIPMAARDDNSQWILEKAVETILVDFIEAEGLKDLVQFAHYNPPSDTMMRLLRAVADRSPHRQVRAASFYSLAKLLGREKSTRTESRQLLERVLKEFSDVILMREKTYGEVVKGDIFELDHLQIGHVAPEIIGKSLDGNLLQLSSFRGRVVMLDFWGNW